MVANHRYNVVDLGKVCRVVVVILCIPAAVLTFPWWGIAYYRSVIN